MTGESAERVPRLLAAHDLQHAGVRDASLLRHGSQALSVRDGLPNGDAPLLLGSGASTGGPLYAGSHLAEVAVELRAGDRASKLIDGLGAAGIVERGRDSESAGFGAEAKVRGLLVPECGRDLHGSSFVGFHAVRIVNGARYVK